MTGGESASWALCTLYSILPSDPPTLALLAPTGRYQHNSEVDSLTSPPLSLSCWAVKSVPTRRDLSYPLLSPNSLAQSRCWIICFLKRKKLLNNQTIGKRMRAANVQECCSVPLGSGVSYPLLLTQLIHSCHPGCLPMVSRSLGQTSPEPSPLLSLTWSQRKLRNPQDCA